MPRSTEKTCPRSPVCAPRHIIEDSSVQVALKLFAAATIAESDARRLVPDNQLGDNPLHGAAADGSASPAVAEAWRQAYYLELAGDLLSAVIDAAAARVALHELWTIGIGPSADDLLPLAASVLM